MSNLTTSVLLTRFVEPKGIDGR